MKQASDNRPIVAPVRTRNTPKLGPVAVMAATLPDYRLLAARFGFDRGAVRPLYTAKLAVGGDKTTGFSLCGPFVGAPYAAMILETLIAWGARQIVFMGWCGAVAPHVRIGHMILPNGALVDEGTSPHYGQSPARPAIPSATLLKHAGRIVRKSAATCLEGLIWTTDGAFRETPAKVKAFQRQGVLAVEMELSALFSVGKSQGVDVVGLLVVSDELSTLTWKPGFKSQAFQTGRRSAADTVQRLIEALT